MANHVLSRLIKPQLLTLFLIFLSSNSVQASTLSSNDLANNPSLYLAMHAKDPVHWQSWQASVLKQAQKTNRIIMISSGYFSCHWCHVMQRENYQNRKVATYLNQHFISVKIDRELMPDLDRYLIAFAKKASGHAGWPEHVFLTPQGYPFFALTYQPHQQFLKTLQRIQRLWRTNPSKIINTAKQSISSKQEHKITNALTKIQFANDFFQSLTDRQDMLSGGLKTENKFPRAPLLLALLSQPNLTEENKYWLMLTLSQMQNLHLRDHINGGFFRYTIDPEWQTPHFEKMLYTQALLAKTYFLAASRFQRHDFSQTAQSTLAYVERHLYNPKSKLFISSESAIDKRGIEGGDYLWTEAELKSALTEKEYKQVSQDWHMDQPAPFVKNQQTPAWLPTSTSKNWSRIQRKLMRPMEVIPKDTKSILAWNGLMLSAYAKATKALPNNRHYRQQGTQLAERLISIFKQPNPPRAFSKNNQPMGKANQQDYAFVVQGLKDWQAVTNDSQLTPTIQALRQHAHQHFLTSKGWHYTSSPLLPGQTGNWAIKDDALPSPTAILDCRKKAALSKVTSQVTTSPLDYASYLNHFDCRNGS
ncbi:thioredoxin domain-containing protein [Hydrogenovibrio kuenenii]|uniref:thioredoxin domain-containing protein n=1 Tax=Hydrogenovibrio kuenenii TaxID=63658 RepID=UPI0004675CF5|nr:DUF255 domain-containing protein [Hydrogenovibrio kuenenii]